MLQKGRLGFAGGFGYCTAVATDVSFGAATIELKRLETYACERMSDACTTTRRAFAFDAKCLYAR